MAKATLTHLAVPGATLDLRVTPTDHLRIWRVGD